eukprot:evm.model.NODE_12390_length_20121_cov_16.951593.4
MQCPSKSPNPPNHYFRFELPSITFLSSSMLRLNPAFITSPSPPLFFVYFQLVVVLLLVLPLVLPLLLLVPLLVPLVVFLVAEEVASAP